MLEEIIIQIVHFIPFHVPHFPQSSQFILNYNYTHSDTFRLNVFIFLFVIVYVTERRSSFFFRVVVNIFVFRIGFLFQNKSKFRSNQQTKKCNAALFLQSLFPVSTRCVEPLFLFVFMFPIWNSRTKPVMSQKPRCTTLKQKQNANLIGLCTCRC